MAPPTGRALVQASTRVTFAAIAADRSLKTESESLQTKASNSFEARMEQPQITDGFSRAMVLDPDTGEQVASVCRLRIDTFLANLYRSKSQLVARN
jgi:hypothetical protein